MIPQGSISKRDIADHIDDSYPGEYSDTERNRLANRYHEQLRDESELHYEVRY